MKIAIPLKTVVFSVTWHCQQFSIIDADNNAIVSETRVTPLPHELDYYRHGQPVRALMVPTSMLWNVNEHSLYLIIRTYKFRQ